MSITNSEEYGASSEDVTISLAADDAKKNENGDQPAGESVLAKLDSKDRKRWHRASLTTRVIANLLHAAPEKASWCVGMLFLQGEASFEVIRDTIKERLLVFPRFRSVLKMGTFSRSKGFKELQISDMDFEYHLRQAFENETISVAQLNEYMGHLLDDAPMDLSKPLWQFTFVPKLDDGRSVLITNISHVIADGMAQIEVLYKLLDTVPGKPAKRVGAKRKKEKASLKKRMGCFFKGVHEGLTVAFSAPDKANVLKLKKPSPTKGCAFTEQVSLEKCKEIKNKLAGATINDVLVTMMSMTLRAYFQEKDDKNVTEKGRKVRGQFPINMRKPGKPLLDKHGNPGNDFVFGFVDFPLSLEDPLETFWSVKRKLDKMKLSPSPLVQKKVASAVEKIAPASELNRTALRLASATTAMLSNVAGPQSEVSLAGYVLDDLMFYLYSPVGLYLGIMTYNGKVSCAVCLDGSLGDPTDLAKHWAPQFEKLYEQVMQHDGVIPKPKKK